MKVKKITIRKVLDSRGKYTAEVDVFSERTSGRFTSPSGASKGAYEAMDYPGNSIDQGIKMFNSTVAPKFTGKEFADITEVDSALHEVDSSSNFSKLGGNVAIAVSLSLLNAFAGEAQTPLYRFLLKDAKVTMPKPESNIIGGGKHAIGGTTIQEFMSVAFGKSFLESISSNVRVHEKVREALLKRFKDIPIGLGDEKAWVAPLPDTEAMQVLADAIKEVSEQNGVKILPAIDFAASSFYKGASYVYKDRSLSRDEQIAFITDLAKKYNLCLIEDPLEKNDYEGHATVTKALKGKSIIIGDDLFVTNKKRFEKGIEIGSCSGILIKPNQIGTFTDMLETVKLAKKNKYATVLSHRSGDTEDNTVSHLAVGLGMDYVKFGTIGGERTAKHNELIRIEEEANA